MTLKILVYGYATGAFSFRELARKLHEDVAFRVLAADNYLPPRTLRNARALHLQELTNLCVQVVKLAREFGWAKLGTIAVAGTKIKPNASCHKAMSYERMKQAERELKAQIDALRPKIDSSEQNGKRGRPPVLNLAQPRTRHCGDSAI